MLCMGGSESRYHARPSCGKCFVNNVKKILRPPTHPFEAILLYDRNQLIRHVILCFRLPYPYMYGVGRLQQRTTCVFQMYDNIAERGHAGGLNCLDI